MKVNIMVLIIIGYSLSIPFLWAVYMLIMTGDGRWLLTIIFAPLMGYLLVNLGHTLKELE